MPQYPLNWKVCGPQRWTGCFAEEISYPCQESIYDSRDYFKGIGYFPPGLTFKNSTFCFKVFCLFHMILIQTHSSAVSIHLHSLRTECGCGTVLPAHGQHTTLGWCQIIVQIWWINNYKSDSEECEGVTCSSAPSINTASPRTEHQVSRFAARGELTASRQGTVSHNNSELFHTHNINMLSLENVPQICFP